MNRIFLITTAVALALSACGKGSSAPTAKPTANKAEGAAKTNSGALKSSKPATTMKTMSAPTPVPAAKSAGSVSVQAPDPTKGGTVEVDTWAFTGIDLDGSGNGNDGVILADDSSLLALFNGSVDDGSGNALPYDAVVWVEGDSVGFIFDYGTAGALACAETATADHGCVSCTSDGTCTEVGTDSSATQ
jgi:hypothetical protein